MSIYRTAAAGDAPVWTLVRIWQQNTPLFEPVAATEDGWILGRDTLDARHLRIRERLESLLRRDTREGVARRLGVTQEALSQWIRRHRLEDV